jgi:hypothetical protein
MSAIWICRGQLIDSFVDPQLKKSSVARKLTPVGTRFWSDAGLRYPKLPASLLTFRVQIAWNQNDSNSAITATITATT